MSLGRHSGDIDRLPIQDRQPRAGAPVGRQVLLQRMADGLLHHVDAP
jgi:hypothetical protein